MTWIDIASIVFVCVTINHLGLVNAIEDIVRHKLPVLNCPKCISFWSVLIYGVWEVGFSDIPLILAISFLASYIAIWVELTEGLIDTLYLKIYEKIYPNAEDNEDSTVERESDTNSTVPKLRENEAEQITCK